MANITSTILAKDFEHAYNVVRLHLTLRYGIEIQEFKPSGKETLHGLSDDRVADYDALVSDGDGRSIKLRDDVPARSKLFSLLHLFGHIAQCNQESAPRMAIDRVRFGKITDEQMANHRSYEYEAGRYGAGLLRECGLGNFLQWYSDLSATDLNFLEAVYRGREKNVPKKDSPIIQLLEEREAKYRVGGGRRFEPLRCPSSLSFVEKIKPEVGKKGVRIL